MGLSALFLDNDGTILDSLSSKLSPIVKLKLFFFKNMPSLYGLAELLTAYVFRPRYKLHEGALEMIERANAKGVAVGIVTDRSLLGFVKSAETAGLDISLFEFIHSRKSCFDALVRRTVPESVDVIRTKLIKGKVGALDGLSIYMHNNRIRRSDTLFVGDDKRDRLAAAQYSLSFYMVDRNSPDFSLVLRTIEGY